MSMLPTTERIQVEIAVAMSIREQYGTNQPGKTYEDGIAEALLWVLGGQEPQNHAQQCSGCGRTGGGYCPDCGPVMGDSTYAGMTTALAGGAN
jgi:hypothetical protein